MSNATLSRITSLTLMFVVLPVLSAQDTSTKPPIARLPRPGILSPDKVKQLEEMVRQNPEDYDSRAALLGHYMFTRFSPSTPGEANQARLGHILWIVEHKPASEIAGRPEASVDKLLEPEAYRQVSNLWIKQSEGVAGRDPAVLANSASFFLIHDPERAEALLKRAIELDPKNASWPQQLGELLSLRIWGISDTPDASIARRALAAFELSLKSIDDMRRSLVLESAAAAAVYAGDFEKAEKYAKETLERAVEPGGAGWNYGNAVHHGNLVLGLVALRKNDLSGAEDFLLKAGETSGSPQLNSFGPNMYLAQELLKVGRKDGVLKYLRLCKKFWNRPELDGWIADVEAGRAPRFGANLRY